MTAASLVTAINADPGDHDSKKRLVALLATVKFADFTPTAKSAVLHCLNDNHIDFLKLTPAWLSLLGDDPVFAPLSALMRLYDYDVFKRQAALHDLGPALNDRYFLAGLKRFLITDLALERLLRHLRRYMLETIDDRDDETFLPFLSALASQCFFNEYIYDVSGEEKEIIAVLEKSAGDSFSRHAVLACYRPMKVAPEMPAPEAFQELVIEQIEQPRLEKEIFGKLETFSAIDDNVSKAVQSQYEENPYPRWRSLDMPAIDPAKDGSAGKTVLIAGCGTGKEAINTALLYRQAQTVAIDLSRTSLAYATRKAREYGADNIRFLHGDILSLDQMDMSFDFITSSGVLHHMKDPAAGLRALAGKLKQGGLMRIALYSAAARRHVDPCQQWVKDKNLPATPDGIRAFRKHAIAFTHQEQFRNVTGFIDFFAMSECRDMFFHVQARNYTGLELKKLIGSANLKLVSMFAPADAQQAYRARFPGDPNGANLENWHEFEKDHPDSFRAMYQLWLAHEDDFMDGRYPAWLTETA